MNLVVGRQDLTVFTHQLGTVAGQSRTGGHGVTTAHQGHLIAAGHGDQEALSLLRNLCGLLQPLAVFAHEGKVLGQAHELGTAANSQLDLLFGSGKVGGEISAAIELDCRSQKACQRLSFAAAVTVRVAAMGSSGLQHSGTGLGGDHRHRVDG